MRLFYAKDSFWVTREHMIMGGQLFAVDEIKDLPLPYDFGAKGSEEALDYWQEMEARLSDKRESYK